MKIKFIEQHIIRGQTRAEDVVYAKGQVVDFKGKVEETYARKYIDRGWAEPYDEAAERARARAESDAAKAAARLEARGKVAIPDDISKLTDADLIKLGQSLSDDQVKTKDEALKAIEAETARRNPT
ncbi:hypothetical protein [Bradyrhizobium guangdongense]|uniref:hypothetical protein n=1 Tax=Bradyrhizobium guangdongense TaxID=1325090 RepID=UPI001319D64C|nr:hypothetical protein [Bradyrhizobium guangdongense]